MMRMSVIRGTLEITDSPVASSAAAINLSAEFFAPATATSPASRVPPTTRITSTPAIVEGSGEVRTLSTMAVHLTRIFTKTGDAGTTGMGDGWRFANTDPRIGAYADTDECNAAIGVALALGQLPEDVRA